jgi:hypothetical protein
MTTVSVVSVLFGERYRQFLPRWWDSLRNLERQPDQVVFITNAASFDALHSMKPSEYGAPIKIVVLDEGRTINEYWDLAFRECQMEWIAALSMDDVFLPEALNDIDRADDEGCELIADGCRFSDQSRIWKGYWNPEEMFSTMTMPGVAPMKKAMFERVGGIPTEIHWWDWAFYIVCAKAGVKVFQSDLIRMVFDEGYRHKTQSGEQLEPSVRAFANEQIRDFANKVRSDK